MILQGNFLRGIFELLRECSKLPLT